MSHPTRTRSEAMHQARRDAEQRQRWRRRLTFGLAAVILALTVAVATVTVRVATNSGTHASAAVNTPTGASADAVLLGDTSAPVTMDLYVDYMCPACGAFEQANGSELTALLDNREVQVKLHTLAFLDSQSNGTEYSTRAANAVATVADAAPDLVWSLHTALYEAQPQEGTDGLSDDEIAEIAMEAGVPQVVVSTFTDDSYESWVTSLTESAFAGGVQGTPTVLIEGVPFEGDVYTTGPLTSAIQDAASADG